MAQFNHKPCSKQPSVREAGEQPAWAQLHAAHLRKGIREQGLHSLKSLVAAGQLQSLP